MKKVKLFTTIASLCLAVALMAFGVYAAANIDMSVTGSIQFAATAIDGSWAWTTTKVTDAVEGVTRAEYTITESGDATNNEITINVTAAGKVEFIVTGTFTNTSNKIATLKAEEGTTEDDSGFFTVSVISGAEVNSEGEATVKTGEQAGTGSVAMKVECTVDARYTIELNTYSFAINFTASPKTAA